MLTMRNIEYEQVKRIPHLTHINQATSYLTFSCDYLIKVNFIEMKHAFDVSCSCTVCGISLDAAEPPETGTQ